MIYNHLPKEKSNLLANEINKKANNLPHDFGNLTLNILKF